MRRFISISAVLVAVVALVPAVASARVQVRTPTSLAGTGITAINGWGWLRVAGARATWTFNAAGALQQARSGSVYLNLSPLVTNTANGGSGYARSVKLVLQSNAPGPGARTLNRTVSLTNPFRPTDPSDSGGIGYQTWGNTSVPTSIWRGATTLTVSFEWRSGHHVAVKQDSAQLAWRVP